MESLWAHKTVGSQIHVSGLKLLACYLMTSFNQTSDKLNHASGEFCRLNTPHKSNIDVLRICAAVAIVLSHISGEFTLKTYDNLVINLILKYYSFLSSGVDLFFVISGYVIMLSLNSVKYNPITFIKGRIRRIVPTYFFITLLVVITNLLTNFWSISNILIPNFETVTTSILFITQLTGNSPAVVQQGWTLEYEMAFYLLVFLTLLIKNRNISTTCICLVIVVFSFTDAYLMLEFLAGIFAYFIQKNDYLKNFGRLLFITGIVFLIPGVVGIVELNQRLYFIFPYTLILLGVLNIKQLEGSFIVFLGKISYPMYLVQALTIPLLYQHIKSQENFSLIHLSLIYIVGVLTTFIISALVLQLYEKPISSKLKSFGW